MKTAVALILFNRPDTTERVMGRIARAKPEKVFLIADGPRPGHGEDRVKCAAARAAAESLVDWDCEVLKKYSDVNLGCGRGPSSGISWVFEHVDEAIILEDDCVPDVTFFGFCEELLARYREDERVMQIAGNNAHFGGRRGSYSYFFSRHNICGGGWATWRRAWRYFDFGVKLWPELRLGPWLVETAGDERAASLWKEMFDQACAGSPEPDFWDYQWTFSCWAQHGLTVIPNRQLVSNIGFRDDATHTKSASRWANLRTQSMSFPLKHPDWMYLDYEADRMFAEGVAAQCKPNAWKVTLYRVLSTVVPTPVLRAVSSGRSKS